MSKEKESSAWLAPGDCSFDYILNPPSLMYIPRLSVVFGECCRVLAEGGAFLMMAPNPINP